MSRAPGPVVVSSRRVAADGLGDDGSDLVGVHVGVGAAVFEPALLGLGHRPRDADGCAPVGGAVAELGVVLRLVGPGQAPLDAHAVDGDVLVDLLPDGLTSGDDGVPAAVLAHGLGREVGVGPGPVPVTQDGLGLQGGIDPEVLGDAEQEPPGHPQVVGHVEGGEHAHLEFPLAHHDFGVGALDADAGVDAGRRVQLDDLASGHLVAAYTAVVGALGGGVAEHRPAERATVLEEGVLLLDAEHRLLVGVLLDHLTQLGPGVGGMGGEVGELHLAHDQLVVGAPQRVGDDEDRAEHAVGVVAQGLVGARPVETPDAWILAVGDDLRLAPEER